MGGEPMAEGRVGVVLATSDGGQTWVRRPAGLTEDHWVTSVSFVDALHGWVSVVQLQRHEWQRQRAAARQEGQPGRC